MPAARMRRVGFTLEWIEEVREIKGVYLFAG
jgi:hypothetical protein